VSVTEYLVGIAYLTITVTALAVIAVALRRRLLPTFRGALARLVEAVFAISALVVTAEILGSFAALSTAPLLALLVALAAVLRCRWRGVAVVRAPVPSSVPDRHWPAILALASVAITAAHWAGGVQDSLSFGIYRQDSTWYHLPVAATIFQTGNTWALHFTDPMALAAWFYPQNSELIHAVGMLALGTDFLSAFLNLGWLALAFLAAWCAGRPAGLSAEAVLATALVLGTEMMQAQAGNAPNDIAGIALLLSAAAIPLNAGSNEAGPPKPWRPPAAALLAAALAAGLAIGAKITLLVPVAVITVGLAWQLRRDRPRLLALWVGGLLAGGGYWYLRNLVHAGNPLPWITVGPLSGPDQISLYPRVPHSVADYAGNPSAWAHSFAPAFGDAIGPLWPLVLTTAAAGLLSAAVRGPAPQRTLGLAGIAAAIAYAFIPVSASGILGHPAGFETNLRYLTPALVLGLLMAALQLGRSTRATRFLAPTLAVVFAVNSFSSWGWLPQDPGLGLALAALLVAAPLALAITVRYGPRFVGLGLVPLLVLAALAYPGERDYLRARYQPDLAPAAATPGFRDSPQWRRLQSWAQHMRNAKIGVVGPPGAFGQYVFFDPHLTNQVLYIGEPGPHGAYRPITTCPSWRRALNRTQVDYLIVTPAASFGTPSQPQESVWLATDPRAQRILAPTPAAIYHLTGPLNPHTCQPNHLPPLLAVPGGATTIPPATPP
jgi:hypothetical protein